MNADDINANVVSKFRSAIPRREIRHLDWNLSGEEAHLSCDIIDYYMLLLNERNEKRGLPKIHSMPAHLSKHYLENGFNGILESYWMKMFRLNFDILLIPICESEHWRLVTVDMRMQSIRYFDSYLNIPILAEHYLEQYLMKMLNFLNYQSQRENGIALNLKEWSLEIPDNIPEQTNSFDCGVFVCQFAEFISRDSPLNFEQKHMKYFRRKMLYEIYTEEMLN